MAIEAKDATRPRLPDGMLGRWVRAVTAGEFVGFAVPAVVGAMVADRSAWVTLPALVAAGCAEGTIVGWSQARVLRTALPALSMRRWILGTAGAAAVAWLLGLLPSVSRDWWSTWPTSAVLFTAAVLVSLLLCSVGVGQWLELRRHLPHAPWWVAANAAAWCLGLLAFFLVTSPLWSPGQPVVLVAAIGACGGLAMAAAMAVTTGWAVIRLVATRDGNRRGQPRVEV